jgi:hypothetical protein
MFLTISEILEMRHQLGNYQELLAFTHLSAILDAVFRINVSTDREMPWFLAELKRVDRSAIWRRRLRLGSTMPAFLPFSAENALKTRYS